MMRRTRGRLPARGRACPALLALAGLAAGVGVAAAQAPVQYTASFENRVHHEARIALRLSDLPDGPVDIVMSRSSPGRYALHEFAKNVYGERATDRAGRPLELERVDPSRWRVSGHTGEVVFEYTLFADHADGTFSGIDATHAHLNMPATFAFAPALSDRPIRVRFDVPDGSGWKAATQLPSAGGPLAFGAPDLQYFMDSPTELSDFDEVSWEVGPPERRQTIRLAVHHLGGEEEVERYAELAKRVVTEESAVFGELPEYDYGTYTFICDYLPWVYGDGMEHRNSTILSGTRPLEGQGAARNLSTLSHEYFHSWNMERIRSQGIEPFDFTRVNMSSDLWFGEGFTSYYDGLAMTRAGVRSLEDWTGDLGGLLNATINAPGRRLRGPAAMSRHSPFVDAASWVDELNTPNTFLSYYTYGAALAAVLDLTLRTRYDTTLDAYMRAAWERHGEPEIPYTARDLERLLGEVSGDTAFAAEFFRRSVAGSEFPDPAPLLERFGLLLRRRNPGRAVLGASLSFEGEVARVAALTLVGSPAYRAGLDEGDALLAVNGRRIRSTEDVERLLGDANPGDSVTVRFEQRGRTVTSRVALAEDPALEVVSFEAAGRTLPPEARRMREAWLGSEARVPAGAGAAGSAGEPEWRIRRAPTGAEFRGLSAAGGGVAWAVGRNGVWARTGDGGESWETGIIPGADSLFLVDVHAVDASTSYVLGTAFSGSLARIYRTRDGGGHWTAVFEDARTGAFYDGIAFWDGRHGVAFGDSREGRMAIVRTEDGEHWVPAERIPRALEGEGGFAASGTAVATAGDRHAWIGTGAGPRARVLRTDDGGRTWSAAETPIPAGPTAGIFGLAFRDTLNGVAVGGDYTDTTSTALNVLRTRDGGRTWELAGRSAPPGVRYGVAYAPGTSPAMLVAVGPSGSGWSTDDGATWTRIDRTGYNTVAFGGREGWAAGVRGLVARLR